MRNRKRKRILASIEAFGTLAILCITMIAVISACNGNKTERFSVAGDDGNGHHYHYVTGYTQTAVYEDGVLITDDGNEWSYDGDFEEGKTYTMWMHDNGTENDVYDDVIMDVYE